jgi:hypothetical protein
LPEAILRDATVREDVQQAKPETFEAAPVSPDGSPSTPDATSKPEVRDTSVDVEMPIDLPPEAETDASVVTPSAIDAPLPQVECHIDRDCPIPSSVCRTTVCINNTCGARYASLGTPCQGGLVCNGDGFCNANHCEDGIQDMDETDVDCGGSCAASGGLCTDDPVQQMCGENSDCASGSCAAQPLDGGVGALDAAGAGPLLCQHPSCTDGVKNGSETDVDCGGSCGATCRHLRPQQICLVPGDCISGVCNAQAPVGGGIDAGSGTLWCQPPSCTDGVKNGNETDVDCGGSCGATCRHAGPQQTCQVPGDCISGVCNGQAPAGVDAGARTLWCQPPGCDDGVRNGDETDMDCGGSCGPTCNHLDPQQRCLVPSDCISGVCRAQAPGTGGSGGTGGGTGSGGTGGGTGSGGTGGSGGGTGAGGTGGGGGTGGNGELWCQPCTSTSDCAHTVSCQNVNIEGEVGVLSTDVQCSESICVPCSEGPCFMAYCPGYELCANDQTCGRTSCVTNEDCPYRTVCGESNYCVGLGDYLCLTGSDCRAGICFPYEDWGQNGFCGCNTSDDCYNEYYRCTSDHYCEFYYNQ